LRETGAHCRRHAGWIAKTDQFTIPQATPFVTVHAEMKTLGMRGAGIGTLVAGGLSIFAGLIVSGAGVEEENFSPSLGQKEVVGGLAMLPVGGLVMATGLVLMALGTSSVRFEPSGPPAASLRLGPAGPALVSERRGP
jgi:hypothetical protein